MSLEQSLTHLDESVSKKSIVRTRHNASQDDASVPSSICGSQIQKLPKKKNLHNKEVFQRINYLHQASMLIASKNKTLSCYYGSLLKELRNKAVIKIDPSIKRDLCKRCSLGFNSDTCETLLESNSSIKILCKHCGYERKYFINENHKLWTEKQQAISEIQEFDEN